MTILVPYHQDELLPVDTFPLPGTREPSTVTAALPSGDIWRRLAALYAAAAETVSSHITASGAATVVSGDCLVALATIAGAQRSGVDPAVVWFDAHGDVHTLQSTTSGYLGGLALRLALGAHPELLARPLGLRAVSERRAVLVDARDLDPAEEHFLATSEVRRVPVADVRAEVLPDGPLVLHVDVDVVDAGELPGLLFPAAGGPATDAVLAACQRVVDTGRVVAVDVACPWRAARDDRERKVRADLLARLTALR